MARLLAFGLLLACCVGAGEAREAAPLADDPVLEARVLAVAEELRCLVCQNETIAASHAELAVDLRRQIRQQLIQGRAEAQITDYMVARYGEFVRYRPAFEATTALLWLGPFALLALAMFAMARTIRLHRARAASHEFSAAEAWRLRQLLEEGGDS